MPPGSGAIRISGTAMSRAGIDLRVQTTISTAGDRDQVSDRCTSGQAGSFIWKWNS